MEITMETVLLIKGKRYTLPEFMAKFGIEDEAKGCLLAGTLVKKGKATIYSATSDEDDLLALLEDDIELTSIVDQINDEEYTAKKVKRDEIAEEVDTVSIALAFNSSADAVKAENWINGFGVEDTEITMKKGAIKLIVKNITPQEYTKIATKYQVEKALNSTVNVTSKAIKNTTDAINYTATNVVAPVAKIAGEAGMNLGKGLLHTTVKVGAGLVNSGAKAVEETKVAMATDTELLKAKKELVDAKDSAISFFKKKLGSNKKRSGIETL